jgi:hypothetical protein
MPFTVGFGRTGRAFEKLILGFGLPKHIINISSRQ